MSKKDVRSYLETATEVVEGWEELFTPIVRINHPSIRRLWKVHDGKDHTYLNRHPNDGSVSFEHRTEKEGDTIFHLGLRYSGALSRQSPDSRILYAHSVKPYFEDGENVALAYRLAEMVSGGAIELGFDCDVDVDRRLSNRGLVINGEFRNGKKTIGDIAELVRTVDNLVTWEIRKADRDMPRPFVYAIVKANDSSSNLYNLVRVGEDPTLMQSERFLTSPVELTQIDASHKRWVEDGKPLLMHNIETLVSVSKGKILTFKDLISRV